MSLSRLCWFHIQIHIQYLNSKSWTNQNFNSSVTPAIVESIHYWHLKSPCSHWLTNPGINTTNCFNRSTYFTTTDQTAISKCQYSLSDLDSDIDSIRSCEYAKRLNTNFNLRCLDPIACSLRVVVPLPYPPWSLYQYILSLVWTDYQMFF